MWGRWRGGRRRSGCSTLTPLLLPPSLLLQAVPRICLQLVAVACVQIAAKSEEVVYPSVRSFTYIAGNAFSVSPDPPPPRPARQPAYLPSHGCAQHLEASISPQRDRLGLPVCPWAVWLAPAGTPPAKALPTGLVPTCTVWDCGQVSGAPQHSAPHPLPAPTLQPDELVRTEALVLRCLAWRIQLPTAHAFLSIFKHALGMQPRTVALACYLLVGVPARTAAPPVKQRALAGCVPRRRLWGRLLLGARHGGPQARPCDPSLPGRSLAAGAGAAGVQHAGLPPLPDGGSREPAGYGLLHPADGRRVRRALASGALLPAGR